MRRHSTNNKLVQEFIEENKAMWDTFISFKALAGILGIMGVIRMHGHMKQRS